MVGQWSPKPLMRVRFLPGLLSYYWDKTFDGGSTPPGPAKYKQLELLVQIY